MLLAASVNLLVVRYVSEVAHETRSPAIESDAKHLWTNVVQATAVLIGLALVEITGEVAFDAVLALALAAYLGWTAATILWSVTGDVLDASLPPEDISFIEDAVNSQAARIAGFHQLRTRRSGQTPHIDLHLTFPASISLTEAHDVTETIEHLIRDRWPKAEIIIHQEPSSARSEDEQGGH